MSRLGFSGSRHGMTDAQKGGIIDTVARGGWTEFHYGDCVGADQEALWLLVELGGAGVIYAHPATMDPEWDAEWCFGSAGKYPELGIVEYAAKHPLARNRDIVRSSDILIACPASDDPFSRSGTWATIRFARNTDDTHVVVILPDGSTMRGDL